MTQEELEKFVELYLMTDLLYTTSIQSDGYYGTVMHSDKEVQKRLVAKLEPVLKDKENYNVPRDEV